MEPQTFGVREIAGRIAGAVARAFPDEVWVRGEIRDLARAQTGHVYFTLVEPDDDPALPPVGLPVTLFANDKLAVNRVLVRAGGAVRMTDGVEVRIRGEVAFYPPRSTVQLRMTWIDPEFTLGRLAAERDRLLRTLVAEGVVAANKGLRLAPVPLRVGLVTSAESAAAADFLHELEASGFGFRVTLVDARVQGPEAPAALAAGLRQAARSGVDVIALVRGGGAKTDLAAFDDERLARTIAAMPVPVVTGIGHEVDRSIADEVAHTAFKTPTACAAALVGRVARMLDGMDVTGRRIAVEARHTLARRHRGLEHRAGRLARSTHGVVRITASRIAAVEERMERGAARIVERAENGVAATGRRIADGAGRRLESAVAQVDATRRRAEVAPGRALARAVEALDRHAAAIAAHDPERLLARGWAIVRDGDGRVVRRAAGLAPGDRIETTMADGVVGSRVEDVVDRVEA